MINWDKLINSGLAIEEFARGKVSGRQLQKQAVFTNIAGEVRKLVRNRGVIKARSLARKALQRRGITV